jgi:methyl-accepting chemotaxis protein
MDAHGDALFGVDAQRSAAVDDVYRIAKRLAESIVQAKGAIAQQQSQTRDIKNAMSDMVSTIDQVAADAKESSTITSSAVQIATEGDELVTAAKGEIERLTQGLSDMEHSLNLLFESTREISGTLSVIGDVAKQTNLLALNAAIEAARAGESGRGFAVVADEVRGLAAKTAGSASEIEHMVGKLHSYADAASTAMVETRRRAEGAISSSAATASTLQKLTAFARDISRYSAKIASTAEAQTSLAHRVDDSVASLTQITDKIVMGVEGDQAMSSELSNTAALLNKGSA